VKRYFIATIIMITLLGCIVSSCNAPQKMNVPIQRTPTYISTEGEKVITIDPPQVTPTLSISSTIAVNSTATVAGNIDHIPENSNSSINDKLPCSQYLNKPLRTFSGLTGKIVLSGDHLSSTDSYLLDGATGQRTRLVVQDKPYLTDAAVSPNGQWLAYVISSKIYKDDQLLISNIDGKVLKQYSIARAKALWPIKRNNIATAIDDDGFEQWLTDDQLIVIYGYIPWIEATTLILNPFTGEWKSYNSNYPGIFTAIGTFHYWDKFRVTRAVYDPSLHLVIYPSYEGIVLFDLGKKQAITTLSDHNFLAVTHPVWAPDGNSFIVDLYASRSDPNHYENRNVFQVFRNGELRQLTSFTGKYPGDFIDYVWSPDGNSVAFWFLDPGNNQQQLSYQLAIMNMSSLEISQYCIPAFLEEDQFPKWAPVWSSDSQYLVVAAKSQMPGHQIEAILLDLSDSHTYKLGIDVYPIGWMKVSRP
jgi:dipeptidyl aminopeptidase/acylaminoacyl peptidase